MIGIRTTPPSRPLRRYAILVGIAFLLRLLAGLPGLTHPEKTFSRPDSGAYIASGRALAETGRFSEEPGSDQPMTDRSPGFPAILAGLFASGADFAAVAVFLMFISALTVVPVHRAGVLLGGEPAGTVGALLYSVNLTAIANAPLFLADTTFTFLIALALAAALGFLRSRSTGWLIVLSVSAGIAVLVRPLELSWGVVLIPIALSRPGAAWRRRVTGTVIALTLFAGAVVPWMARNAAVGAGFRVDTSSGSVLLDHMAVAVLAAHTGMSEESVRREVETTAARVFAADPERYRGPGERTAYRERKAREILLEYPWTTLRLGVQPLILAPDAPAFLENLGATTGGGGTLEVLHRDGVWAAVRHYFGRKLWLLAPLLPTVLIALATYVGAGWELLGWLRDRRGRLLLLFLAFVIFYLVLPGPIAMQRYQLPALPLLCAMAGVAISRWMTHRRVRIEPGT